VNRVKTTGTAAQQNTGRHCDSFSTVEKFAFVKEKCQFVVSGLMTMLHGLGLEVAEPYLLIFVLK